MMVAWLATGLVTADCLVLNERIPASTWNEHLGPDQEYCVCDLVKIVGHENE